MTKKRRVPRYERRALEEKRARAEIALRTAPTNREALKPYRTYSYSDPDFVGRGFYTDKPFACADCGTEEIWTAWQQKWWYEVAKGDVFTTARRCRLCRRRERERRTEARRVHLDGLARKRARRGSS